MNSQYTEEYLTLTTKKGRLLTPGTFLAYTLRGEAKRWACRYSRSLVASLLRVGATPTRSIGGRTAYVRQEAV